MKKVIYTMAALSLVASAYANASVEVLNLDNSTVHFYKTQDAMHDNSIIIETKKNLLLLEPIPFFADMADINAYTKSLGKPVSKVITNYHCFGMSNYEGVEVLMPEGMIAFTNSDVFAGLTAKFKQGFGEDKLDFTAPKNPTPISAKTLLSIDGADIKFFDGATSDFPALSVLIDNGVYYSHFAPMKSHFNTMQIKKASDIDAVLAELNNIKSTGAKYIVSSHGGYLASQEDVEFQIEYLTNLKDFLAKTDDAGTLGQMLLGKYPHLAGYENIKALTQALLPETECATREEIRAAMNGYFKSVTALDESLIKDVWATGNVSFINARGHLMGVDNIAKFMLRAFAGNNNAVLSSTNEQITMLGENGAVVSLYWMWTEVGKDTGRGRESLVFNKIDGKWKLVHVHYSPLPAKN